MPGRPTHLPDFDDPPVVEVSLSVQFERLPHFHAPYLGLLWDEFRDKFPLVEDHGSIERVVETFGVRQEARLGIQLLSPDTSPVIRSWFLNEARTELIQVQQDRLIHNWRKVGEGVGEGEEYPHYEYIRHHFDREMRTFYEFVERNNIGEFVPNQCEVTYVNHIEAGKGWENHGELSEILSVWSVPNSESYLVDMENARLAWKYVITDDNQAPIGRLHVSLQPVFRTSDGKPIFVLTLTSRGKPFDRDPAGVLKFMDTGREHIVLCFTAITTAKMHKVWARKDV